MTKGPKLGYTKRALLAFVVVGAVMSASLSACGGGNSQSTAAKSVSVFDLRPQDCLNPPKANPNLAVSSVKVLPCTEPHVDEVYCVLPYNQTPPTSIQQCPDRPPRFAGSLTQDYPGEQALTNYAKRALSQSVPVLRRFGLYRELALLHIPVPVSPELGRFAQAGPGNRVYPAHHRRPAETVRQGLEALGR